MAVEIEKKYLLTAEQRAGVLESLKRINAIFIREDFEENIIYQGGILNREGAVLRIRKVGGETILTYKKRLGDQTAVKRQVEHETRVEDAARMDEIIGCLGFEKALVYEKRRGIWRLDEVEIVLDELPFGLYMEIEGTESSISRAEKLLGASSLRIEHLTYPHLTQKFGEKKGKLTEARFPLN